MSERANVALLGIISITGGLTAMITMVDFAERFALFAGGFCVLIGLLCFAAVAVDIHKARIKAKMMQMIHDMNGYHILRTFRKIYKGL